MEFNYDDSDKEMIQFLNDHQEIYMDFDFLPEIVNIESSLISETETETESIPNFEPSGSDFEQHKL